MNVYIAFAILLLYEYVNAYTYVYNKTAELHETLLSNYDKDIKPCTGCATPLTVNISFVLTSLNDMDEVHGEMNSVGYLYVIWIEDRMMWNPMNYGGVGSILLPSDKIWVPPLVVGNPSLKLTVLNYCEICPVRVLYNGTAIWTPGEVFRTKCYPDIYKYPYDKQECYISLIPWAYLSSEVILNTPEAEVNRPFYHDNGEWVLQKTLSEASVDNGLPMARFTFTYSRRPQFFFVNVILPIISLSLLNCIVYWIPVESGERISYSITVLLSFAVFMTLVSDNIPKTSDPMSLLCYYLISMFTGSALVMVSTVVNMKVYYTHPDIPVSSLYRKMVICQRKGWCFCKNGRPVLKSSSTTTMVRVINVETKEAIKDMYQNESTVLDDDADDEDGGEITWKDVAKCIDIISMVRFFVYFLSATVVQLLVISSP